MLANRARGRPVGFLARKAVDLAARYLRTARAGVGLNPYAGSTNRTGKLRLDILGDAGAVARALDLVRQSRPEDLAHVVDSADRARRGEVTILSHVAGPGASVSWNLDFVSGARWPAKFHAAYLYSDLLDLSRPSDIKVPWDLGRLQVLPSLALAYRLTGDLGYVDAAADRFASWDQASPVGFGVTWAIGMEASLRAISLIHTAGFVAGTGGEGRFVTSRLTESLGEHGRFLLRNIEYSDVNGNHYTSCILGLLYLGIALPDHPESEEWRSTAVRALVHEIGAETYPDGVCHEGSIPYHRLVAEIFVHAALVARRSGIDLGAPFRKRLEQMIEFTAGYTKPGGEAPVWGDADDGRVHNLGAQPMNDHRYLLHLSGALHGRSDLAARGGALPLDAAALLDDSLQDAFDRLPRTPVAVGSEGFPQGGFFVLRAQKGYALVDCGDVGMRGRGGHGHHDTLAVELSLGGVDVLADTGCSSYTRDRNERWASISVRAHNVASVDGQEPARFADDRLTQAGAYKWEVRAWRPEALQFVGAHHGYGEQATYERALSLDASGKACEFVDRFSGSGEHAATWMFHFAEPWSEPKVEAGRAVLEQGDAVIELIWDHPEGKMTALRTPIYPTYGNRRERWALRFDTAFSGSITVRFNFRLQEQVQHS